MNKMDWALQICEVILVYLRRQEYVVVGRYPIFPLRMRSRAEVYLDLSALGLSGKVEL